LDNKDCMTTYYKSVRFINGKPRWIISDENYNIIGNPTKEQLRLALDEDDRPKICCICGKDMSLPNWYKHKCDKYNCTRHLCIDCYRIYSPRSTQNKIKKMADSRIGNLDPSCPRGKGFIGQQIIAKTHGVEDCNLKTDNFNFYVDLSKISGYGYVEVKIATLNRINGRYEFNGIKPEKFDTLILICMDENWKDINKMYAIPWEIAMIHGKYITIYENPSKIVWYDEFKIDNRQYNDTYHSMELKNCKILRKRAI